MPPDPILRRPGHHPRIRAQLRLDIRGAGRQADDPHTCVSECLAERHREQRIAIVDQEALARQKAMAGIESRLLIRSKTSRRALSDPDGQERPFVVCRNPWPKCLTTLVAYVAPRDGRARGSRLSRRCLEARDLFRVSRHDRRLQRLDEHLDGGRGRIAHVLESCGVPLLMKYT